MTSRTQLRAALERFLREPSEQRREELDALLLRYWNESEEREQRARFLRTLRQPPGDEG